MLFCRVSGVDLPAIAGVLLRQIHHDAVTRHLGYDRGGGDGKGSGVTLHNRLGPASQPGGNQIAVDQHMGRRSRKPCNGALHRQLAGPQDVERVDFFHRRMGDGHLRDGHDFRVKPIPSCSRKRLAVAQTLRNACRVKDHRRRRYWPCQGAPANLINPRYRQKPAVMGGGFKTEIGGYAGHDPDLAKTGGKKKGRDARGLCDPAPRRPNLRTVNCDRRRQCLFQQKWRKPRDWPQPGWNWQGSV